MEEIDHSKTNVLLIGVSEYLYDTSLSAIPNVNVNIELLKKYLEDKNYVGIPKENLTISINETRSQILKKIRQVTNETYSKNHTLIIYYSGHGILSPEDFHLYLTTTEVTVDDLIDAININEFKRYVKQSHAGRKILILDCCHSGAIIGSMANKVSSLQSNLNDFEGTYVITSASEYEPALFSVENPHLPTHFTGKFIQIVVEGLDIESDYCSLKDIYINIKDDFKRLGYPIPQQSNYNNAGEMLLVKNQKKFGNKTLIDKVWDETLLINESTSYNNFIDKYPDCKYVDIAKSYLVELDEQDWNNSVIINTFEGFLNYLDRNNNGIHQVEANQKIDDIKIEIIKKEEKDDLDAWNIACQGNHQPHYNNYLLYHPRGKYAEIARDRIQAIKNDSEKMDKLFNLRLKIFIFLFFALIATLLVISILKSIHSHN